MGKLSTILVPFDFSIAAKRALEYAVYFTARHHDVQIILVYISGLGNFKLLPENFIKLEEKYRTSLKNRLQWTIYEGNLTQAILEVQQSKAVDVIFIGSFGIHKDSTTEHTNTSNMIVETNCPVLAVPWDYEDFQLKRIALVLGKEEIEDDNCLATLLQIAQRFNAKIHVITVEKRLATYSGSKKEEKIINYYLENFYTERVFIQNEDVLDGILTYTCNHDIDLVTILSKSCESSKQDLTQLLALHSKVPVLVLN